MITKEQLLQNRSITETEPTVATLILEVPWNETSFANIQRILFDAVEGEVFDDVDILNYEPVSYDSETKAFQMEYTLGVFGVFDLFKSIEETN
jgi:hypothetical protein